MIKRSITTSVLVLLLVLSLVYPFPFSVAPVEAESWRYFEYPTQTFVLEKQDYFGAFLEWNFVPVDGQHSDKRVWNFSWVHKDYVEVYNDTTGEIVAVYENPIPKVKAIIDSGLSEDEVTGLLNETVYAEIREVAGFPENRWNFAGHCMRLHNYPVSLVDPAQSRFFHQDERPPEHIDIMNYTEGWFTFKLNTNLWDKHNPIALRIKIGFASTITYSGETNTITCTGGTEGSPIGFWDLWNASDVEGWEVVNKNLTLNPADYPNYAQYFIDCKVVIGDSSTETWFADTNKQIAFADGLLTADWQSIITVKLNASFRIGVLDDAADKVTSRGCSMVFLESTYRAYLIDGNDEGIIKIFSSLIENSGGKRSFLDEFPAGSMIYNSILTGFVGTRFFRGAIYHVFINWADAYMYAITRQDAQSCDRVYVSNYGWALDIEWTSSDFTITNLEADNILDSTFRIDHYSGNLYLIDATVEDWTFDWLTSTSAVVFRQYSFNLHVVDEDGTDLQNANVTLSYAGQGGAQVGSWLTPANGSIPEQTLSMGFYNQTGGDSLYDYNPYLLSITTDNATLANYNTSFTLDDTTDWTIALQEEQYVFDIITPPALTAIIGLPFITMFMLTKQKKRRR